MFGHTYQVLQKALKHGHIRYVTEGRQSPSPEMWGRFTNYAGEVPTIVCHTLWMVWLPGEKHCRGPAQVSGEEFKGLEHEMMIAIVFHRGECTQLVVR